MAPVDRAMLGFTPVTTNAADHPGTADEREGLYDAMLHVYDEDFAHHRFSQKSPTVIGGSSSRKHIKGRSGIRPRTGTSANPSWSNIKSNPWGGFPDQSSSHPFIAAVTQI